MHLLAREELDPQLEGDLRLIDRESAEHVELSFSPAILAAYQRRLNRFIAGCAEKFRMVAIRLRWGE